MLKSSRTTLLNYMRFHNDRTRRQYSAEYGLTWTKEITPRTDQDVQLYGWLHNYPYAKQNDLTWWAHRKRSRCTIANYALKSKSASRFADLLRRYEESAVHQLSLSGGYTLLLPTNDAFTALGISLVQRVENDDQLAKELIFNHIIEGMRVWY